MRYFLKLSFDGTPYSGWQIQENAPSVQAVIEKALSTILNENISTIGCGRTDTGVHAHQFYLHFEFDRILDSFFYVHKLNGILPKSMAIQSLFDVSKEAHARFSALSRTYKYYYHFERNPFLIDKSAQIMGEIPDLQILEACCDIVLKHKNFKAFSRTKTQVKHFECEMHEAYWQYEGKQLVFTVKANRFLRNMVRAMVGTMMKAGIGRIDLDTFEAIINSGDRKKAGTSAPACGLYLHKIEYPENLNII